MNDGLDRRTMCRTIDHFAPWFGAIVVVAAIALIATNRWPDALGVLLSLIPIGAMAARVRRTLRDAIPKNPRPTGMLIIAVTRAMPGVILIFVGNLIGGDFIVISCTAMGATIISLSGLIVAMAMSLQPT